MTNQSDLKGALIVIAEAEMTLDCALVALAPRLAAAVEQIPTTPHAYAAPLEHLYSTIVDFTDTVKRLVAAATEVADLVAEPVTTLPTYTVGGHRYIQVPEGPPDQTTALIEETRTDPLGSLLKIH